MASGMSIENIPSELIHKILANEELSIKDVINFKSACKQFHSFEFLKDFWKTKFFQRWPELEDVYSAYFERDVTDWFAEIQTSETAEKKWMEYLTIEMPKEYFARPWLSLSCVSDQLNLWWYGRERLCIVEPSIEQLRAANPRIPYMMFAQLQRFLRKKSTNLTLKYFGWKLYYFMRQDHGSLCLSEDTTLEEAMTFLAEWFQPEELMVLSNIQFMLDSIAKEVKESLRVANPSHPLFDKSSEILEEWKVNKLSENQFDDKESMQIINCLRETMQRLGFCKATTSKANYFYFDEVLGSRVGKWEILIAIFDSVARRLGVRCLLGESYSVHGDCSYLGWESKSGKLMNIYNSRGSPIEESPGGIFDEFGFTYFLSCFTKSMTGFRCLEDLSLVDLIEATGEEETDNYIQREIDYYAGNKIDKVSLVKKLRDTANFTKKYLDDDLFCEYLYGTSKFSKAITEVRESRDPRVKHFVGKPLILKSTGQKCVVTGWTAAGSKIWYDVLDEEGMLRYATQDSLVQVKPNEKIEEIEDDETGRYFTGFDGFHYIPNEVLASIYPLDADARKATRVQTEKKFYSHS